VFYVFTNETYDYGTYTVVPGSSQYVAAVPEPSAALLLALGLILIAAIRHGLRIGASARPLRRAYGGVLDAFRDRRDLSAIFRPSRDSRPTSPR